MPRTLQSQLAPSHCQRHRLSLYRLLENVGTCQAFTNSSLNPMMTVLIKGLLHFGLWSQTVRNHGNKEQEDNREEHTKQDSKT